MSESELVFTLTGKDKSKSWIVDIETNGLDNPDIIHCIVARNLNNEVKIFRSKAEYEEFKSLCEKADTIIGHNFIAFDWVWIGAILGYWIKPTKILDTLILSQLLHQGIENGHSLEAWGSRFGLLKTGTDIIDFSILTPELQERCIRDTEVNLRAYNFLCGKLDRSEFKEAIDVEHRMAFICLNMHLDGFKYNKPEADKLYAEVSERLRLLDEEISSISKPKVKLIKTFTPRFNKNGTLNRSQFKWYKGEDWTIFNGGDITLFEYRTFNPNSNKDLVQLLNEAGWKPVNRTKGGKGYKLDEQNLATLPDNAPEAARLLVERLLVVARLRTLDTWKKAYSERTGRIHGRFHTLGTYTHRLSHTKPNMGNISAEKSIKYKGEKLKKMATELGGRMRKLWISEKNAWLVGTDMEGAHLRILGHYMNDEQYIQSLLHGDKKKGTDVHSRNKQTIGSICADRDLAKTFIFTFLNGGGGRKVMEIFGCTRQEADEALAKFVASYPGLRLLKEISFPRWASKGFFRGIDGRLVSCSSEHLMMAALLQNAEAVLMKHANVLWRKELNAKRIQYKQVNLVHDEFQTEVYGTRDIAEDVGRIQSKAITTIGQRFRIRCPLAGEYKVGHDWLETH